jgi:hypothetical protein
MQVSASITYFPSASEIASTGHSPAQAPQATQSSEILYAMIQNLLFLFDTSIVTHFFEFATVFFDFLQFF